MKQGISPIQHFKVRRQAQLSNLQMQSLTQLYQPILGSKTISVYLTLASLPMQNAVWSQDMMHSQLLETLNFGIAKLSHSKRKLEAIGLLKSYRQLDSHIEANMQEMIYDLQMPYDPFQFFNHPQLSVVLCRAIGDQEFTMKSRLFQLEKIDTDKYKDVTVSFESIFNHLLHKEEPLPEWQKEDAFLQYQTGQTQFDVSSESFDYDEFLAHLKAMGINELNFNDALKAYVLTSHQLYGLNEVEMVEVVNLSRNVKTNHIQLDRLNHIAKQRFQLKQKGQGQSRHNANLPKRPTPNIESLMPEEIKKKFPQLSDSEIQLAILFQKVSPQHLIDSIKRQQDGFVTSNETRFVKEIQQKSTLDMSVINAICYYILVIENKDNIYKNMLERLANRWQQANIKDVYAALQWMKNDQITQKHQEKQSQISRNYSNKYSKGSRHVEQVPDWMNDQADARSITNQEVSGPNNLETNEATLKDRLNKILKKEET